MLNWGPEEFSLAISSISSQMLRSRKWMQQTGSSGSMIVFLVDISRYDQVVEDSATSEIICEIMSVMKVFEYAVNSPMSSSAYPVVWFSNSSLFRDKLARSPVQVWFPDYTGGPNFEKAVEYFRLKFRGLYRGGKEFYARSGEPEDDRLVRELVFIAKDVVIQEDLKSIL